MKLLFLDFETQGSDPETTNPTEIGAVQVQIPNPGLDPETALAKHWAASGGFCELERLSTLIWHVDYPPQTPEIVELTGITDEMLRERGVAPSEAFTRLGALVAGSALILAHKADFDRGVYVTGMKRLGYEWFTPPWLCTINDVPWPKKFTCKKLSHLAFEHGMEQDRTKLHRADYDCDLLIQLLFKHYRFEDILAYYHKPWAYLRLSIPGPWVGRGGDGGIGKAHAQALGFSYERARGTEAPVFEKKWVLRCKEDEIPAIKEKVLARTNAYPLTRINLGESHANPS